MRVSEVQYPFFTARRSENKMPRVLAIQAQTQSRQIQNMIEGARDKRVPVRHCFTNDRLEIS